jgi:hypothetical protein
MPGNELDTFFLPYTFGKLLLLLLLLLLQCEACRHP